MGPVARADGHDAPRLIDEAIPSVTADVDDRLIRGEDSVREIIVAQELPDVLDRIEFGGAGRQRQNGDVVGRREFRRHAPAGLIDNENGVGAGGDGGADLGKMQVHRVRVAPWQDETRAFAFRRADRAEDVRPLRALIVRR